MREGTLLHQCVPSANIALHTHPVPPCPVDFVISDLVGEGYTSPSQGHYSRKPQRTPSQLLPPLAGKAMGNRGAPRRVERLDAWMTRQTDRCTESGSRRRVGEGRDSAFNPPTVRQLGPFSDFQGAAVLRGTFLKKLARN